MKLVYNGAHPSVFVPELDLPGVDPDVARGVPVEVPTALAERLLEQDTWSKSKEKPEKHQ